jgi:hypothetical protein
MRVLAIALAAAAVACGGDGTSPPAPLSGTYTLQTIDAQALPYRYDVRPGGEWYVVGGSISFSGDNTATLTQLGREHAVAPNPEEWTDMAPRTVTLTYTRSGNEMTITTSSEIVPSEGVGLSVSPDGATCPVTVRSIRSFTTTTATTRSCSPEARRHA